MIELVHLTKTFPGVVALDRVSLTLRAGEVHALVGENGAGKSTLIQLLSGNLRPDAGEVRLQGEVVHLADAHAARRLGIVTVHQEVDLFPDLDVAENVRLEQGLPSGVCGWINRAEERKRCRQALECMRAALSPFAPASTLSPAQRQLLLLGAALARAPRVLILDEPTSSLSGAESEVLFDQVRRFRAAGTAILYVSHRFEEIFALADVVTVLRDGRRVGGGSLAQMTPGELLHLMVGREMETGAPVRPTPGPVRLRCRDFSAADGTCAGVTLEVRAGEVLGLYGLVGAGRSEWAQALLGLRPLARGEVWLGGASVVPRGPGAMAGRGLAYVPEDRLQQGLCRGLSVRANVVLATLRQRARFLWVSSLNEAHRTSAIADRLAIRRRSVEQPAGTLSGGNQQKVVLARWLEREPAVLVLDEPTRGVDVAAKGEIHGLLRRLAGEGRAIVLISSDLPEIMTQSHRVGVFREGRLVGFFDPRVHGATEIAAAALPDSKDKGRTPGESPEDRRSEASPSCQSILPWREAGLFLIVLLLFGFLQVRTGQFLQAGSLHSLVTDTALLGFCALGAGLVLLAGGIDISLGSLMALSACLAGKLWEGQAPLPLVVAVALAAGGAGGFVNAALTLAGRVHPIVITLGTLSLYRGLALWFLDQDVQVRGQDREPLVVPVLGLPLVAWLGLAVVGALAVFLRRTVPGRELYALGSNPAAAARAGISRARVWVLAFTLQGMLAGLAGLFYLARSGQLQPSSYENKTLEAIAAAVVGGVAITGGRGSVLGILLGCLFLVSLGPACVFLKLPTTWQRTLVGAVTVLAVTLDTLWRRRRS